MLTCLAGGRASHELQDLLRRQGPAGAVHNLAWLGRPTRLLHSEVLSWESDPWSGGGYLAFAPGQDPNWREAFARPAGRIAFAGEHTSFKWQGYLNGAALSGQRAAAEIHSMALDLAGR